MGKNNSVQKMSLTTLSWYELFFFLATRGSVLLLKALTGMKPSTPALPLASSQPLTDSTPQEPKSLYSRSVLYHLKRQHKIAIDSTPRG